MQVYIYTLYVSNISNNIKENSIKFWYDLDNFLKVKNMAYTLSHLVICHISLIYSFFFFYNPSLFTNKKGGWWMMSQLFLSVGHFGNVTLVWLEVRRHRICAGGACYLTYESVTGYQEGHSVWEIKKSAPPSEIRYFSSRAKSWHVTVSGTRTLRSSADGAGEGWRKVWTAGLGRGGWSGIGLDERCKKLMRFHPKKRRKKKKTLLLFIEHIHERGRDEFHDRIHDALLLLLVATAGGNRLLGTGEAALGGLLHRSRCLGFLLLLLLDAVLDRKHKRGCL